MILEDFIRGPFAATRVQEVDLGAAAAAGRAAAPASRRAATPSPPIARASSANERRATSWWQKGLLLARGLYSAAGTSPPSRADSTGPRSSTSGRRASLRRTRGGGPHDVVLCVYDLVAHLVLIACARLALFMKAAAHGGPRLRALLAAGRAVPKSWWRPGALDICAFARTSREIRGAGPDDNCLGRAGWPEEPRLFVPQIRWPRKRARPIQMGNLLATLVADPLGPRNKFHAGPLA